MNERISSGWDFKPDEDTLKGSFFSPQGSENSTVSYQVFLLTAWRRQQRDPRSRGSVAIYHAFLILKIGGIRKAVGDIDEAIRALRKSRLEAINKNIP